MSDDDRWRWHGYDYGWRRVMLGRYEKRSAIDDDGRWFSAGAADKAEAFFRRKFNRPAPRETPCATGDDAIRTNYRGIPWPLLTSSERSRLQPEHDALMVKHRATMASIETRSARALREQHTRYQTREQSGAKAYELAKADPETMVRLNASLGCSNGELP